MNMPTPKLLRGFLRTSFLLLLTAPVLATAVTYSVVGRYTDAEWPWYDLTQISYRTVNYSGSIASTLTNNTPAYSASQAQWKVVRSDGYTFNLGDLYYPAVGGDWTQFSGTITLWYTYDVNPLYSISVAAYTVTYANGQATLDQPGGPNPANNTGIHVTNRLESLNLKRLLGLGGQVQTATGAESTSRTLFRFAGARSWEFSIGYNSILARTQLNYPTTGHGWNHNFATRLVPGTNPQIQWTPTSINRFTVTADPNVYTSIQDGARYDVLAHQTNGNWLLTRADQSSLLFDSSGLLIEDRDSRGRKLLLTYSSGRISLIRDPVSGTQLTLAYNGNGLLQTLTDATNATVTLGYTITGDNRLLTTITNQNGKIARLGYDANRQLVTLKDHDYNTLTTNVYDASGRVISQDDGVAGNQLMEFAYAEQATPGSVIYAPSDTGQTTPICLPATGTYASRVTSVTNHAGQTVTYAYDANGRLTTATLNGQVTTLGYDADGILASITDPANVTTAVAPRYLTTVTDRTGEDRLYTFDSNFNLLSVENPLGHVTAYTYDSANRVTAIIDPLSHTRSFTYDSQGNILTATDEAGKLVTNTYDARNNLLTTTDSLSQVTTRTYDTTNNLLTLTDALGRTTTWTYNSNSLPLTMTLPGGGVHNYTYTAGRLTQASDPAGVATVFSYNNNGLLLYREDPFGKRVTFTYDPLGNILTAKNAYNETTTCTYDLRNRLATLTDPAGALTTYAYDHNNNRLTAVRTASGLPTLTTSWTYDGEDRLLTLTTPDPDPAASGAGKDPLVTTHAYDTAGRLTSVAAPGGTTTYDYDAAGRLLTVTDPAGKETESTYDTRGLPLAITDPLNRTTQFTYDDRGQRLTAVDPLSRTTTFAYDALQRLTQVTDPGSLVATQGFDLDGNLVSLQNPANETTSLAFDTTGRLTGVTTPEGHATVHTYDSRGLLATVTEPSTQQTTFAYDDAQRPNGSADALGTITLGRDSAGRVTTVVEGAKTLTRAYDAYGRLVSFTDGDGNVIGYTYDGLGRLTKLTYPGSPLKEVAYAYDTAGRLASDTDWANRVTAYSYDAVGRLAETLRPNGTKQARVYDDAGQLTELKELAPDGTTVIYSGAATYDFAGQLTGETLTPAIAPMSVSLVQTVDGDNRLLTHNGSNVTFDADGNLLAVASGVAPASYSYDVRNRLTGAGGLTYGYDAENRRVSITDGSGTTTYVVNPNATLDQVLMRTVGGVTTYYVYGLGLLHEETGGTPRYYHFDRRGDTVAMSDGAGAVTGRAAYGLYGELLSSSGTLDTPFLFNGRWGVQTDENGLYYHRARCYHPDLRRFLNQDVVLGSITDGASLNRFAYANGNPVSLIDPFGLMAVDFAANVFLNADIFREGMAAWEESERYLPEDRVMMRTVVLLGMAVGTADVALNALSGGSKAAVTGGIKAATHADNVVRAVHAAESGAVKYIGKLDDLKGIPRSQTLLDDLPNLGSARANYYQNSSVLRKALRDGFEIRDASAFRLNSSPDPTLLRPGRTVGQSFLGAERLIMSNKGMTLNQAGTYILKNP